MRTTRMALSLTVIALAIVFLPGRALACSCVASPDMTQSERDAAEAKDADAVFAGRVVKIFDAKKGAKVYSSGDPIRFTFAVESVIKGDVSPRQHVYSTRDGASCGYYFEKGKRYLVFTYKNPQDGSLSAGLCSQTRPLDEGQAVPMDGQPMGGGPEEAPAPGIPDAPTIPDEGTGWVPLTLALAGAAALAGGAMVLLGRR